MLQIESSRFPAENPSVGVLILTGTVDSLDAIKLNRSLGTLLGEGIYDVIIDMTNVSFVSSAGWGVFVCRLSLLWKKKGRFLLVGMKPDVRQVCELIGLAHAERVSIYDHLEEALVATSQKA